MAAFQLCRIEIGVIGKHGNESVDAWLTQKFGGEAGEVEFPFRYRFMCFLLVLCTLCSIAILFVVDLDRLRFGFLPRPTFGSNLQVYIMLTISLQHANKDMYTLGDRVKICESLARIASQNLNHAIMCCFLVEDTIENVLRNFLIFLVFAFGHVLHRL